MQKKCKQNASSLLKDPTLSYQTTATNPKKAHSTIITKTEWQQLSNAEFGSDYERFHHPNVSFENSLHLDGSRDDSDSENGPSVFYFEVDHQNVILHVDKNAFQSIAAVR